MKPHHAVAGWIALVIGCSGGGGGGGVPVDLELTEANTKTILSTAATTLPGCTYSATGTLAAPQASQGSQSELGTLVQQLAIGDTNPFGPLALRGSRPADKSGECGGTRSFSDYSHTNGVTQGTIVFEGYCRKSQSGEPTTFDGELTFVDTGTPTDSGPMRATFTAQAPELTATTKGKTYDVALTGFRYAVTTQGSTPSNAAPDVMTVGGLTVKDADGNRVYQVSNYTRRIGATQVSSAGVVCDATGCVGVKTADGEPVTISGGQIQSGTLLVTGTNGTTATVELVPGAVPTAQVTSINGVAQPSGSLSQGSCQPLPALSL